MNEYVVEIYVRAKCTMDVFAKNSEEAQDMALEMFEESDMNELNIYQYEVEYIDQIG